MPTYSRRTIEELLECRAPRWVETVVDEFLQVELYDGDELVGRLKSAIADNPILFGGVGMMQPRDAAERRIRNAFSLHAVVMAAAATKTRAPDGRLVHVLNDALEGGADVKAHWERLGRQRKAGA